jgi:hypothetical protein
MAKALLAALVVVCLSLVLSCGSGDPFVGSWKEASKKSDARDLVIARTGQGYRVAFLSGGSGSSWWPLTRDGDTLNGSWKVTVPEGTSAPTVGIKIVRDGGRLLLTDNLLRDFPLTRVSDRTDAPSPPD